ncbi:MAG TPA: solute:sodium symporter family transporter [Planctomycetes bacterium]|nr:solute:sodium symporter family transporter [Planctomycetota bacterium]
MHLNSFDVLTFVAFLLVVVVVSLLASRKEDSSEDYFLAGRKLGWWLIGFSLIASNISTEHFVGMAGKAFGRVGLAIASYEWMSAISLVIVAWWLLPKFLRIGIYTMPEFLEYRFDRGTRTIMAIYLLVLYVFALLATVLYSGAQGLNGVFDFPQMLVEHFQMDPEDAQEWATLGGIWGIGLIAAIYTIYGGLKAVVWSDLIQGGALLGGGALVLYFGLRLVGGGELVAGGGVSGGDVLSGWKAFCAQNEDKLHVILPWNDPNIPWLAVFVGGLWIPNLFYWGLNQFITQRTLGAKSLSEGQRGIFLACLFKLAIPFLILMPGIMAFQLFGDSLLAKTHGALSKAGELAYPHMIAQIMPPMLRGVMLAALAGAVMSTFNSGINSASTIFTIDLYKKYIRPEASARQQVRVGRVATALIALFACLVGPLPGKFEGVFTYIQEIWGFISPGIVAAFIGGILIRRAPAQAGRLALLLSPPLYGICRVPKWIFEGVYEHEVRDGVKTLLGKGGEAVGGFTQSLYDFNNWAFLHHMALVFVVLILVMLWVTRLRPMETPVEYPSSEIDVRVPRSNYVLGSLIVLATVALYVVFR